MARILVNDGLGQIGVKMLQDAGHEVQTQNIPQEELLSELANFDAICVRSATKVRKELIDVSPKLRAICRGGVGLDNIDVDYAKSKNIAVINTPAASSRSVAELVFSHLLSVARSVYLANRAMPTSGHTDFKKLKKSYSKGFELYGKTMGIIGLGRIGIETAQIAVGMGMNVIGVDPMVAQVTLKIGQPELKITKDLKMSTLDEMLTKSDIVTLHVPFLGNPVLSTNEFNKMKVGTILINASRGGTVDEDAMLEALNSGKLGAAGIDVFANEPTPRTDILQHPKVSLSPHIGASTVEAQQKIAIELAEKLNAALA